MSVLFKTVSALEKCFLDESIDSKTAFTEAAVLRGEEFAFEIAYTGDNPAVFPRDTFRLRIDSDLADSITVREIVSVPVRVPCFASSDDNYLRKTPGLYPDLLAPCDPNGNLYATPGQLKSLYVEVNVPEDCTPGAHTITLVFIQNGEERTADFTLNVLDAVLPKQETVVTEWFHTDCIANYYNLETFSETHWDYIEKFMKTAVKNGINAILTPVFTPPLDTAVGGERRTTQLVDVTERTDILGNSVWEFGFDKVERWVETGRRAGVQYFEISHLYTQWGVAHAPKIMGTDRCGNYRRLFGWETDSLSPEYKNFLRAFLTAFLAKMKELGADKQCFFHISDEPGTAHLDAYRNAKAQIEDILEGYPIMDALSNFEFYQTGAVDHPIPSNNHIEPFLEAGIPGLWTYYCCSQHSLVSNRFIAMPMQRGRVIGMQMYKYNIAGFLQWGYNFYNSCHSTRTVNPYEVTDGDYWVPAGDTFSVYPGENGEALESLHLKSFTMALTDMRAMKAAEAKAGREAVMAILEREGEITFKQYPHSAQWLLETREMINDLRK